MIRRLAGIVVAGLVAAASLAVAPPIVAAAAPVFGTPTATSTFEVGIDLSEPVTLPSGVKRVEALVLTGGSTRTLVEPVPDAGSGATTLHFRFATPPGSLIPNTPVTLGFRVVLDDGTSAVGPAASVRYDDTRYDWKTLSGRVVRVHWTEGDDAFGRRALAVGEKAIDDVSALLGVQETDPIDFFVYADRTAFYNVLGPATRENVGGVEFTDIRTMLANIAPGAIDDPWVGIVIPHELTHLVFATAVTNPYHFPPRWLNEGIAVYLSQGYGAADRAAVGSAVGAGTLMPLTSLGGEFPTTGDRFSLAYAESVSSVDFLVRKYGRDAMVKLIRGYADGVTDDQAFQAGVGTDVAGFQSAWLADLGAPVPSPAGPQPAPTGPLPPDWLSAAATAGVAGSAAASSPPAGPQNPESGTSPGLIIALVIVAVVVVGLLALLARRRAGVRGARPSAVAGPESEPAITGSEPADTEPAGSEPVDTEVAAPEPAPPEPRAFETPASGTTSPDEERSLE